MKKVIALLLAVLMLASLAACSSTPANADAATPAETGTTPSADTTDTADTPETKDETPAVAGDVTIRMWTFLDPTNTSNGRSIALQKMIDRFEEENPGVKVVVEPQQWDTMTGKFMAAATTGEAPDIMWCARDELFGVLNAGLNVFLVAVCGMDVDGVAIATVLSNVVSCIVVVWMLCREKGVIHLSLRELRLDRELLGRMLAIGLPAGLQSTVFTFSNVCIQSTLNSFGTAAVAGSSAALNYEFFAYFPVVAFGQAAVTFSSQNFGAGQYDRCRKIFRQTMLLSLVCAEVMGLGFVFGKELFVRFFTAEADVAEFAYIRMCTLLPFYFLVPLYEVGGAALRGIGHSLAPAVLTVLGTCVLRLIWVFTVCRIWPDYRVLMLVYPITWALTGAAIMVCYFLVDRKLAKKFLTAQTH